MQSENFIQNITFRVLTGLLFMNKFEDALLSSQIGDFKYFKSSFHTRKIALVLSISLDEICIQPLPSNTNVDV